MEETRYRDGVGAGTEAYLSQMGSSIFLSGCQGRSDGALRINEWVNSNHWFLNIWEHLDGQTEVEKKQRQQLCCACTRKPQGGGSDNQGWIWREAEWEVWLCRQKGKTGFQSLIIWEGRESEYSQGSIREPAIQIDLLGAVLSTDGSGLEEPKVVPKGWMRETIYEILTFFYQCFIKISVLKNVYWY